MRGLQVFVSAITALILCTTATPTQQLAAAPAATPQVSASQDECRAYITMVPLDPDVVKLLASPVVLPKPNVFASASFQQLQEWDLPSKVMAWRDRPVAEELSRRWDEFNRKWNPAWQQDHSANYRRYSSRPLSPERWHDLDKWFAKEGPKKLPGVCNDAGKAAYVLAVGIVSNGSGASPSGSSNPHEYEQISSVRAQDNSVGPNAGSYSPTAHESRPDELNGLGGSGSTDDYVCTYLFRTNGAPLGQGGTRQPAPDYYYCHSGADTPRSALTTMMKYLSKNGLQ
jgi:hypothetical protein